MTKNIIIVTPSRRYEYITMINRKQAFSFVRADIGRLHSEDSPLTQSLRALLYLQLGFHLAAVSSSPPAPPERAAVRERRRELCVERRGAA